MSKPSYNIAFFGTPDLCLPILDALHTNGFSPSLIITNPDRPVGRKQELTAPPVKVWAQQHDIEVFQPEKLDDAAFEKLSTTSWDLFIVFAYGHIMPEKFITLPRRGTINIHPSLLPRWRGPTPGEATILAGDTVGGITIQDMRMKLDSGPIIAQESIELTGNETAPQLYDELIMRGARMLIDVLPGWLEGTITPTPQDETQVTKCSLTKKEDGELLTTDADEIKWRKYRAYFGWPGTFYFDTDGKRVKITEATFRDGKFIIQKIIREGESEKAI